MTSAPNNMSCAKASTWRNSMLVEHASANLRLGSRIARRRVIRTGLGAIAVPAVLRVIPAHAQSRVIKIGHVSPKTGPLAGFGEADGFILEHVRGILAGGLQSGGRTYQVQIISKDSQSSGSRAAEVASELILGDKGDPAKGFTWTYHFFWGLEDVIGAFLALWDSAPTNKVVGGLFPNDADGNAWGDTKLGLPPAVAAAGPARGRLQADRPRPLPAHEQRLHLADFRVQGGRRGDRHRQHDPAGLRD